MSKQSRVQAKSTISPGLTRLSASLPERQHTLGTHVCVQREAVGQATHPAASSLVRDVVESPGRPLDTATRSFMEPRFGYDFSQVRVHTDDRAAESARAVSANAYTAGNHVAFGPGQYTPGTQAGRRLIAHELTHTVQQAMGSVAPPEGNRGLSIGHSTGKFEQDARKTADSVTTQSDVDPSNTGHLETLPAAQTAPADAFIQRSDADVSADLSRGSAVGGTVGGIGGGLSAIFAGIGLIPAFESATAAKRQAKAAEEQTEESKKQTGIAQENLDVAKQQLAVAENPPAPAPTTGGIVVNNNSGYADIPSVPAPKGSLAPKAETGDQPVTVLKVSQGDKDFATFNAFMKSDGKEIKGGYLQDGDSKGYVGGSAASNLNLTLKPVAGPPAPFVTPKGKETLVASVKFLISGNNIAPRTKAGTDIQHFSGAVTLTAAGGVILSKPFNVNPGSPAPGDGTTAPAVTINLPATSPAPGGGQNPTPVPTPTKAGGGATK